MKLVLLILGGLKLGKILTSGGTMLLSIAIYAMAYGWPFAFGFVALLFVHEMGHYMAARQRGLNVGVPIFIPFVGAWIALKDQPVDVETEAYVAFAGPFVGTLAAFATYFLARSYDSHLMLAISYAGFFLNLFNLLPVSPLDGGRITAIVSPRVWLLGAPLMVALLLYRPSPMLVLIAIIAIPQLIKAWRYDPNAEENVRYYNASTAVKAEYALLYLLLTAVLALMVYSVHEMLGAGRPLPE